MIPEIHRRVACPLPNRQLFRRRDSRTRLDAKWKCEIPRRYLAEKLQRPDRNRFGNRDRYRVRFTKFHAAEVVTASFARRRNLEYCPAPNWIRPVEIAAFFALAKENGRGGRKIMKRDPRLVRGRTDGVRTCSWKFERRSGDLVVSSRVTPTSALAFRPIECTLYRLVDAYLPAEAFSRATLCNFRGAAYYCTESVMYARARCVSRRIYFIPRSLYSKSSFVLLISRQSHRWRPQR